MHVNIINLNVTLSLAADLTLSIKLIHTQYHQQN